MKFWQLLVLVVLLTQCQQPTSQNGIINMSNPEAGQDESL